MSTASQRQSSSKKNLLADALFRLYDEALTRFADEKGSLGSESSFPRPLEEVIGKVKLVTDELVGATQAAAKDAMSLRPWAPTEAIGTS
ncbi:hypothetical protein EG327_010449, partial [Venturia inaequalis]